MQGRQGPADGLHLHTCAIQMLTLIEKRDFSDSRRKWKILSEELSPAPEATRLCGYFSFYLGSYRAVQWQRKPQHEPCSLFRSLLSSAAALLSSHT